MESLHCISGAEDEDEEKQEEEEEAYFSLRLHVWMEDIVYYFYVVIMGSYLSRRTSDMQLKGN